MPSTAVRCSPPTAKARAPWPPHPAPRKPGHARARFDAQTWQQDLAAATPAAHKVADRARAALERDGAPIAQLRPCAAEGQDGTRLPGCMKLYLPEPTDANASPWGIVFVLATDDHGAYLAALAFGLRHPPENSNKQTVYQLAHKRLNG